MSARTRTPWFALIVGVALAAAACSRSSATQGDGSGSKTRETGSSTSPTVETTAPSPSPTIDAELAAWLDLQGEACKAVIRPPKGTGGSQSAFYQAEIDQFRAWMRTVGKADVPAEFRSEQSKVVKLYQRAVEATQDAMVADLKLTTTAVFPSEAALDEAVADQRRTSRAFIHAINQARKALIAFSRHAGFRCA